MSKVKSDKIPHYELFYLISNKFSENELAPIHEKIKKTITNLEGTVTFEQDWGKKKLAYPIKGFRHGYYYLVEFDLPGINLVKINNSLRLDSNLLRHSIVKKKKFTPEELAALKARAKMIETKREEHNKEKDETEKPVEKPLIKKTVKKTEKITEDKIEFKDLDDKLDKILDTNDLV